MLPDMKVYQLYADMCQTLAHPKRLEILDALTEREMTVRDLAELLEIPQANLSQHLAILKQRKMVFGRRDGINIFYSLSDPKIVEACHLLKEVLIAQLSEGEQIAREFRRT